MSETSKYFSKKRSSNQSEVESKNKKIKSAKEAKRAPRTSVVDESIVKLAEIGFDKRLTSEFFELDCLTLSRRLINKYLVRKLDNDELVVGKIVEVEAYLGGSDRASHTYNNKMTDRLKAMYMKAGTAYVYNIYGMYCCLNISAKEPGAGVLIRALEPVYGLGHMRKNRNLSQEKKEWELANGPSKLCIAMNISKKLFDQVDLASSSDMWLQDGSNILSIVPVDESNVVKAKRIGIDYAGEEAINQLYRFYVSGSKFVSVRSKEEVQID